MQKQGHLWGRILLFLIALAAGTFVLLFVFEIAAIPIAPVQTYLACPQGTTIRYTWVHASWDKPGEQTMEKACVNPDGVKKDVFSNAVYNQRQYDLFLPVGFASTLALEGAWGGVRSLRRRK
jgi:hypothetical protein